MWRRTWLISDDKLLYHSCQLCRLPHWDLKKKKKEQHADSLFGLFSPILVQCFKFSFQWCDQDWFIFFICICITWLSIQQYPVSNKLKDCFFILLLLYWIHFIHGGWWGWGRVQRHQPIHFLLQAICITPVFESPQPFLLSCPNQIMTEPFVIQVGH